MRKKSSHRKANWKSIYIQIHALFFIFREKLVLGFFSFLAKKLKTWNACLKLIEGFLQIYTFQNIYFRLIPSDTLNLVTVTASYLTHPNVNILYFLFSYCILLSSQQSVWSTIPFQSPESYVASVWLHGYSALSSWNSLRSCTARVF